MTEPEGTPPEGTPPEGTPPEGTPPEGTPPAIPPEGLPAPWYLAEGVQGQGDKPDYFKSDKYQNLSEQAKAYKDLEGQFGAFTGAPKEGYAMNLSEDLQNAGMSIDEKDPLYVEAVKFASEKNMSQEGFNDMLNLYATAELARENANDAYKTEQIATLENGQARIDNLIAWGKSKLSEDLFKGFEDMPTSAEAVKTLEHIISLTQATPLTPDNVDNGDSVISAEELQAMQFEKDEFGNRRLSTDPAFKAKFEDLMRKRHGGHDHNIVIGG